MILGIFIVFLSLGSWAKPTFLISYFDAFGGASFNNSTIVATELEKRFSNTEELEIKLCPLQTVFDKSFDQLENCLNEMPQAPLMVLSLGEAICELKVETIARNRDKSYGPDNEGNERHGPIIKGASEYIGLRYPLQEMYCALNPEERKSLIISNDGGSFVCNHLMYQMGHHYPQFQFGFIHVPAHNCEGLELKNFKAIEKLEKMLLGLVDASTKPAKGVNLPHWENQSRFPVERQELRVLRQQNSEGACLNEFTGRLKSHDVWDWFRSLKQMN